MLKTSVLGIITARGQSKGVPRKNIRSCAGHPLLYYTTKEALISQLLTDCILSTEDEEIANIGRDLGVEVPFLRPQELASDNAKTLPALVDALYKYESLVGKQYEYILTLQPTSPLRRAEDIDNAISLAYEKQAESVVSIVKLEDISLDKLKYFEDGLINDAVLEEREGVPRQQRKPLYRRNGAIYITRRDILLNGSMFGSHIYGYEMPLKESLDINTQYDFDYAEFLLSRESYEKE